MMMVSTSLAIFPAVDKCQQLKPGTINHLSSNIFRLLHPKDGTERMMMVSTSPAKFPAVDNNANNSSLEL
jgi:hypothetical protein